MPVRSQPRPAAPPAPSGTRVGTPAPARRQSQPITAPGAAHSPEPAPELAAGTRIHQYELIRELGRGGMGMVWAARDTKLGRRVAMKFVLAPERPIVERFVVEARATAQCSHENIVIIHEVDELSGTPYMVLEFLEGQPLRDIVGELGAATRLPVSRAVELMLPVARALERAHGLGIVHRDLKPENVFVTSAGQVKVLDFGIAKALGQRDERGAAVAAAAMGPLNMTREGTMVGTLPYMSPEQMGIGEVDHQSDIWAFGIMMFELLAARHPIEPLTTETLITHAVSDEITVPSIAELVPEIPEALALLVDGCLRKAKAERVASAHDLVAALELLQPHRRGRQLAEGESPYPGLAAFQETDANRFFGRDRDIARMTARIREHPLTGVIGPSGAGKSSFIRAGVGPALKASGESWDVVTLRPGRHPMAALASIVQRLTTQAGTKLDGRLAEHDDLMSRLTREPGTLGTLLRNRAQQTKRRILLFIDQLEELYTLVPEPAERLAFTAALAGVADDTAAPLRVVVSMRSDFLDRVAEDPRFMEELSRGLVFLSAPDREGLRDAIVQPVEMVGHRYESTAMVDDMLGALASTPGALPLLQFAAAKLWDARDRQRRLISEESYRAIGGITGALATHADDVVAGMTPAVKKLTQRIFRQLVTPERTRAIVELADLHQLSTDQGEVARLVDQLVHARLLVVQSRGESSSGTVEIVHESLIERWPTLRRWLDEDQEDAGFLAQLSAAAKQWDAKGRASGLLWRGEAMEDARRWYQARPRELTARDQAFLDAVLALARRGTRMRRAIWTVVFATLLAVAAGAVIALVQIRQAEQQAETNAATATKALTDLQKSSAARDAAQKAQHEADAKASEAEKAKQAEAQRAAAEAQKAAEAGLALDVEKQKSAAQLADDNKKLQAALGDAQKAEAVAKKAQADAEKANAQLKLDNAEKQKKIDELNKEALSRKLKGM